MTELSTYDLSNMRRDIFTKVYVALRKQGRSSIDEEGSCQYRGSNNTRCAAGWLLPDDQWEPGIEGLSVDESSVWKRFGLPDQLKDFIRALQRAHDAGYTAGFASWESKMAAIADLFDGPCLLTAQMEYELEVVNDAARS